MIETKEIELFNEEETRALGKQLAESSLDKPLLIFLRGDLGAGKTTFSQGFIGRLIQYTQTISSPTYAYMNRYEAKIPIFHFDLYRIEDPQNAEDLGLEFFIHDETSLRLIEWPERLESSIRTPDIDISFSRLQNHRRVEIRQIF